MPSHEEESEEEYGDAWQDEDDQEIEINMLDTHRNRKLRENEQEEVLVGSAYEKRLRSRFESIQETPAWARVMEKGSEEDEILRSTRSLISAKTTHLPKTVLGITRMKDANIKDPAWV